jgi:phosphate transport system substrate-binding protein
VEFAYALQNKMSYVLLENKNGKFVKPTIESFQSAAANADWKNAPGFYMVLTDQPGDESWPITGASFILLHKDQPDAERAKAILAFFDWCYKHGKEIATTLHYVPMPESVVEMIQSQWKSEIKASGSPVW